MRYVLLDRFLELERGRRAIATKVFDPREEIFADHFPGFPVVPGLLLTEAMAQAAGWLIAWSSDFEVWPLLCLVEGAKFRRFVSPGEELTIEARVDSLAPPLAARTELRVGNERVAEARLGFTTLAAFAGGSVSPELAPWARGVFARLAPGEGAGGGAS